MRHELKTWPEFFEQIWNGDKTFEIRLSDREFAFGDTLFLREYNPEKDYYTGRELEVDVKYVLYQGGSAHHGITEVSGLKPGYVCMSIERCDAKGERDPGDSSGLRDPR